MTSTSTPLTESTKETPSRGLRGHRLPNRPLAEWLQQRLAAIPGSAGISTSLNRTVGTRPAAGKPKGLKIPKPLSENASIKEKHKLLKQALLAVFDAGAMTRKEAFKLVETLGDEKEVKSAFRKLTSGVPLLCPCESPEGGEMTFETWASIGRRMRKPDKQKLVDRHSIPVPRKKGSALSGESPMAALAGSCGISERQLYRHITEEYASVELATADYLLTNEGSATLNDLWPWLEFVTMPLTAGTVFDDLAHWESEQIDAPVDEIIFQLENIPGEMSLTGELNRALFDILKFAAAEQGVWPNCTSTDIEFGGATAWNAWLKARRENREVSLSVYLALLQDREGEEYLSVPAAKTRFDRQTKAGERRLTEKQNEQLQRLAEKNEENFGPGVLPTLKQLSQAANLGSVDGKVVHGQMNKAKIVRKDDSAAPVNTSTERAPHGA